MRLWKIVSKTYWAKEMSFGTLADLPKPRRRIGRFSRSNREMAVPPMDWGTSISISNVGTKRKLPIAKPCEWSPTDVDGLVALSVVLVQPRAGASNAKRFAEAEGFARRAVTMAPKNAVAWDRLGVALQSRGVWTNETEQAYRRAVELDPQFAVAYAHLARVLNKMGRGTDAAPLYDQAGQLAKDAATLNLIAESLQAEQQWENSEPVLKRALELEARNPTALLLYGPGAFGL